MAADIALALSCPVMTLFAAVSITAEEIKKVVLAEDDFRHEMIVGGILKNYQPAPFGHFQAQIMPPSHGGTYKDEITGKTRQFDYRCQITKRHGSTTQSIFLAAECKNLNPDLPLVVSGRVRNFDESYHVLISRQAEEAPQTRKVKSRYYGFGGFVGKSLLRLKKKQNELCADGDSEIYDRWTQALASSHDLASGAIDIKLTSPASAFVMPLVVVPDDSLWTVAYKDNGELEGEPKQVDDCTFYVDKKLLLDLPFVITHIHFITRKGLSEMLAKFSDSDHHVWDAIFS